MSSGTIERPYEGNGLLTAISSSGYSRFAAQCETVPLAVDDVLFDVDDEIEYVHFPTSGCLSIVTKMEHGGVVEIGTVGHEGMSAVSLIHSVGSVPAKCFVQVHGEAKRMSRRAFDAELSTTPQVASLMKRYAQFWSDQLGISVACNAVHSVEQRCARWLLMTHDRVDGDVLPLKQDFLAVMLGVRRPTVTLAATQFQRDGLIKYTRGRITIVNRAGLEAASCECYGALRTAYERLI